MLSRICALLLASSSLLFASCSDRLQIDSIPPRTANVGVQYRYKVEVDGGIGTRELTLRNRPPGMVALHTRHLIVWTPQAGDVGAHTVKLRVEDDWGSRAEQTYTLQVQ